MRKIIETLSTLILWGVFIFGSGSVFNEFFSNTAVAEKIMKHLSLLAWSPALAFGIFAAMLASVRFSKYKAVKKEILNVHAVQWSTHDLTKARNGKVVDLHFEGTGLTCNVVTRNEVAEVLHSENQTVYVTLVPPIAEESPRELATFRVAVALVPGSRLQLEKNVSK